MATNPVSLTQQQEDASDADVRTGLVWRLCNSELISLLGQLMRNGRWPEVSGLESVFAVISQTDAERHLKASFGNKAVMITGATQPQSCRYGYSCKKGLKPELPNQDSFLMLTLGRKWGLYGIFDGHGSKGHDVSNFVKEILSKVLVVQPQLDTHPDAALLNAFRVTQDLIAEATRIGMIDARCSGCTATVVLHDMQQNTLFIAHVGDSRAVLGIKSTETGAWVSQDLTQDHKPNLPQERMRIEQAGGQVFFDGYSNWRVYVRGKRYPGLNMSRAMGDLLGATDAGISSNPDVGVISMAPMPVEEESHKARSASPKGAAPEAPVNMEPLDGGMDTIQMLQRSLDSQKAMRKSNSNQAASPFVSSRRLEKEDKMLVIASDGVWDMLPSTRVVQVVGAYPAERAMDAAEELSKLSWLCWLSGSGGTSSDDISALVIRFDT